MIERMVIGFVISFVLKQLEKFKDQIDFAKVKEDLDNRVRKLIPGEWFDDDAVAMVNKVFDACHKVLDASGELKQIMELLAAKKYSEAANALKDLILGSFNPEESVYKALALL